MDRYYFSNLWLGARKQAAGKRESLLSFIEIHDKGGDVFFEDIN